MSFGNYYILHYYIKHFKNCYILSWKIITFCIKIVITFCINIITFCISIKFCSVTGQGLKLTPGQQTMSVKNRFCPVKSLDGPTFCLIFYSSNVIQTFTFLKYDWSRLDIIDIGEGQKWGKREKKASRSRTFIT